ncbi:MAG: hypothetical protein QXN34_06865 [Archaeoglobaceae archaeon]
MSVEIPKEMQRFIISMFFMSAFFCLTALAFFITHDTNLIERILTLLAGALSAIIGFYFGAKTVEMRK